MSGLAEARGRRAVAASLLAVVLIGGYFVTSGRPAGAGSPVVYLIHAAVLALGFWFPAMKIGHPRGVLRAWRSLLPWMLGWTLVWDLATAGVVGARGLFQAWWIVYPSGVVLFTALLLLHGAVVRRWWE